jgi:hypothetical protein
MINIEALATKSIPELNELLAAVQYVIGAKTLGLPIATANIDEREQKCRTIVQAALRPASTKRAKEEFDSRIELMRSAFKEGAFFRTDDVSALLHVGDSRSGQILTAAVRSGIVTRVHPTVGLYCFGEPVRFNGIHQGEFYSFDDAAQFLLKRIDESFTRVDLERLLGIVLNGKRLHGVLKSMRKYADVTMCGKNYSTRYVITKRDTRVSKAVADIIKLQLHDTTVHPSVHQLATSIGATPELTQQGLDVMRNQMAFGIRKSVAGLEISSPAHE